jgi:hypothetical protein
VDQSRHGSLHHLQLGHNTVYQQGKQQGVLGHGEVHWEAVREVVQGLQVEPHRANLHLCMKKFRKYICTKWLK